MENRYAAITIIILCVLSLILGINISLKQENPLSKKAPVGQSNLKSMFSGGNKIALITLEGPISSESSSSLIGELYSAESVQRSLLQVEKDTSVKGVLLRINSPGGTVAASQEIYNTIIRIRKEKPVIVSMADVAASGGYYIASAADRILASPGTLTGSIGVIFNTLEVSTLADKLGINSNVIKSGKFKDIGSMYKKMSSDEKSLLQDLINQTYQQFVVAVTKGRVQRKDEYKVKKSVLNEEILKKYADGRIFNGEQAQKLGFVDDLGGLYEAHLLATEMAKEKFHLTDEEIPMVSYNKPSGISDILFNMSESFMSQKNFDAIIPFSAKNNHKTLYLWE
jgi:protease-4